VSLKGGKEGAEKESFGCRSPSRTTGKRPLRGKSELTLAKRRIRGEAGEGEKVEGWRRIACE